MEGRKGTVRPPLSKPLVHPEASSVRALRGISSPAFDGHEEALYAKNFKKEEKVMREQLGKQVYLAALFKGR